MVTVHVPFEGLSIVHSRVSGPRVRGSLWVATDGISFPEERWGDFPVEVLSGWAYCGWGGDAPQVGRKDLLFANGPYRLRHAQGGTLVGLESRQGGQVERVREHVTWDEVRSAIVDAGNDVVAWSERVGFKSRDVRTLKELCETGRRPGADLA